MSDMLDLDGDLLGIQFADGSLELTALWRTVMAFWDRCGVSERRYEVTTADGIARVAPRDVEKSFERLRAYAVRIFGRSSVLTVEQTIRGGDSVVIAMSDLPDAEELDQVVVDLQSVGELTLARRYSGRYDRLENTEQLDALDEEHRAKVQVTWDDVFEEHVVDISSNPGRAVERDGYFEELGQHMWLAQRFFQLTGARKETLSRFPMRSVGNLVRVELSSRPFTLANPPSEAVRELLFPAAR